MLGCHSGRDISFSSVSGACLWNQAGGGAQRAGYSGAECTGIPSLAWKKKFKTPFLTEPSIAAGYLFLPAPNSGVIIIDAETGEMADVFKVGGPVTTPVAVLDSLMVLNEYGRRLSAVNWVTAERLWTVDIYGSDFAPLILDGGVYWHDGRGNITCFDLWEGKRIWGIAADYDIIAPPSACSLGVLFSSDKGRIECLSPRDGSVLWSSETGSRVKSAPAIFNDKFAFCTVEGRVVR